MVAAQIREDRAYAALQKAYGDLLASLGVDQYPDGIDLAAPREAGATIARHFTGLPAEVLSLAAGIAASAKQAAAAAVTEGKK